MARPNKYNLQYFPLDVDFFDNHKLLMIGEDFGVKGEYMAIRLMAMVYERDGYYLEWKDGSDVSIAKRVGNGFTGALVGEILKSCLKHGLFDSVLFSEKKVLSSKGIQERWMEVMKSMRRKPEVNVQYWLISSEETIVNVEETAPTATFSTQKEMKGNERKLNEKKEWNIMPTHEIDLPLPDFHIQSVIEQIKITRGVLLPAEKIIGMYAVFKVQYLTGKKFYQDDSSVFSHFKNWIKNQNFKLEEKSTDGSNKKSNHGQSSGAIKLMHKAKSDWERLNGI